MILKNFFTHPVEGRFRERIASMMKSLRIWSKTEKVEARVRGIEALNSKFEAKEPLVGIQTKTVEPQHGEVKQPGIILSGLKSKLSSEELISRVEENTKNL